MRKHLGWLPVLLCGINGFYPAMRILGRIFGFGYILRDASLCVMIAAALTLICTLVLLLARPSYPRACRIALILAVPLGCVYTIMMEPMLGHAGLILVQLCWILPMILYLVQPERRRAGIAVVAICVLIQLTLLPGMLMFCWMNPTEERTQLVSMHDDGRYTYETYEVDEGALGASRYTEIRSIHKAELLFGTFYPHYERIVD